MPTYCYQCQDCGAEREVHHPINGPAPGSCTKCGGVRLKRLLYAVAGWMKE